MLKVDDHVGKLIVKTMFNIKQTIKQSSPSVYKAHQLLLLAILIVSIRTILKHLHYISFIVAPRK